MGHAKHECKAGEKAVKPDNRQRKDKEGFQKVVRKQYVVKQKPPSIEPTAMPTPERPKTPSNIRPHSRSHSPGKCHDEVTTA